MYGAKEKVVRFAVASRFCVILLQFIFNILLPDHDAGVFLSPLDPGEKISVCDTAVDFLFGGLEKWDSQYFIHVARYGYTYENTLAFSPLYPMAVRYLSYILSPVFFGLNEHSITVLAALFINLLCFVKSAAVFYDLSKIVLRDNRLAYKAAILYCVNPASIFFSAFYSESMFAFLTFHVMLAFVEDNPYVYLPIGLSAIVRSNGLINVGFPLYSFVRSFLRYILPKFSKNFVNLSGEIRLPFRSRSMFGTLLWLVNIIFLSIVPYALLQLYNYSLFCSGKEFKIPDHVLKYGLDKDFLMPGTQEKTEWCESQLPLAYSYVQKKYWDVGLMKYYTIKQVPNFLLAFPILWVMIGRSLAYLRVNKTELLTLGSFSKLETRNNAKSKGKDYHGEDSMFVFVVHGLFLTIFCVLFVHIQVSTRLLCSASPLLYWYAVFYMENSRKEDEDFRDFDTEENLRSKWRVFLFNQKTYSKRDVIVLSYFIGYLVTGCIMYPNFLPWT